MLNTGTKRYLLKLVITYYHSMLRRTDSKRRVDVPRITTQLVYFPSLIFDKRLFFVLTLFWSAGDQGSFFPPMSVQIFTSNLEPVNPSLDKITKRYVLKPNILIIAYHHSQLWRTESKCLADARVCRITIRFVLFLFIDRW
jgi:hypothetical protein